MPCCHLQQPASSSYMLHPLPRPPPPPAAASHRLRTQAAEPGSHPPTKPGPAHLHPPHKVAVCDEPHFRLGHCIIYEVGQGQPILRRGPHTEDALGVVSGWVLGLLGQPAACRVSGRVQRIRGSERCHAPIGGPMAAAECSAQSTAWHGHLNRVA